MANFFNFTEDEQLIIILELANAVLVKALSRVVTASESQLREETLTAVENQIPKMSDSSLIELLASVRKVQTDALNTAIDDFNLNNK